MSTWEEQMAELGYRFDKEGNIVGKEHSDDWFAMPAYADVCRCGVQQLRKNLHLSEWDERAPVPQLLTCAVCYAEPKHPCAAACRVCKRG